MGSENNTRFEVSYSTWQEANPRGKGYDNINDYYLYSPRDIDIARMTNDYYLYSPRDIDIARMTWVDDNLSI